VFDTHKITKSMQTARQGPAEAGLQAGATLQNRYLIQGVLGVGGMGSVYKARDLRFPNVTKLVAVKEILNLAPDPALREMIVKTFEREANILAMLSHPAIPQIYDYFTQADRAFLVQEFIEGKDLEAHLADLQGFLHEDQVIEWAVQLCDVLSYLHSHKPDPIVFRDMKPSNVMLDQHSRIRLIDFGIARGFTAGQKGTMIGTEGYSPPEQYRGEASPTGDIYALGATLHHLLSKQDPRLEPPFSFAERPVRKLNPNVTPEFEAIVNTALNYNPAERFPNAQAMKEALLSLRRSRTGILTGRMPASGAPPVAEGGALPKAGAAASSAPAKATSDIAPIWAFKCEDEIRGNPAVGAETVFVGAYDNNLYAINMLEGKLLWKYATDGGLPGSPVTHNDLVLIGSEDRRLHVVSTKSGRVQWTYYTEGPIRTTPLVGEGHVFVGSDDEHLHAVNLTTSRRTWRVKATGPVRARPAISSDRLFFGCESGEFYSVDFSGEVKWRFKAKRGLTSSPRLNAGVIYFGSLDGFVYALDVSSGWAIWKFRANRAVLSSPALAGNLLFVGSADKNIYAVDIRNGRESWHFETSDQVASSPAVYKNTVYIGSVDGHLYALDQVSGKLRWKFKSEGPITSSPVIANDLVFIGSMDHHLYALAA
jgi:outer membrane protein assembly factor BamB